MGHVHKMHYGTYTEDDGKQLCANCFG
jgi:hypothetical protein